MVTTDATHILNKLPYTKPFLFVDELLHVDEKRAIGTYTFSSGHEFYKGHFKDNPVTPGVILTECMAQIGVACLGAYLLNEEFIKGNAIALTSAETEFLKPVLPDEKVTVSSEKIYFRFGKLKCRAIMINEAGDIVCRSTISGIIKNIA
jgi:3-hydroxyacyl-[acyl-carrier-protein] dehydratase